MPSTIIKLLASSQQLMAMATTTTLPVMEPISLPRSAFTGTRGSSCESQFLSFSCSSPLSHFKGQLTTSTTRGNGAGAGSTRIPISCVVWGYSVKPAIGEHVAPFCTRLAVGYAGGFQSHQVKNISTQSTHDTWNSMAMGSLNLLGICVINYC